jgi:ABC-type Na+ efflux pump permease subunit
MRWRIVVAIARKDLKVILRSRAVMIPMIVVPLLILIIMPAAVSLLLRLEGFEQEVASDLGRMLENIPGHVGAQLEGLDDAQKWAVVMLGYAFGPLFLILPLMVSSIVAADSFAGEKERGTLEALLYTPTTDLELFVGKCASAWFTALVVTLAGFVAYCTTGNLAAWPIMQRVFLPNVTWLLLAFWVAPAAAGVGLGATVLISARTKTLQDAMQLSGMLVIPVVLLVLGQVSGVLWLSNWLVVGLGAALWVLFAIIARLGGRLFRRSEVLARR